LVTEMNPNVVVISVLAILSTLLIGLLLVTLIILRKKHLQMARECGAGTFVNFASLERDGKLPYNWSKNGLKKRKLTNPVQLDDFDAYIKDMAKDSDYKFSLQFEELKLIGLDIPHFAADLPLNRCKNRYTNILPYDFSRVRLVSMNEEEGTDYINANYIPGYNSPQEYIATQGPLPETRNDFWKMVLQQKSQIIVMLTQCNEKRRVKCDHYWPFTEEPIAYGDITVEMISEEERDDWACRHFRINYVSHDAHVQGLSPFHTKYGNDLKFTFQCPQIPFIETEPHICLRTSQACTYQAPSSLSSCNRDHMPPNPETTYCLPFTENVC
uniref:Tyrosine-protein phosphatase domain-containing protein n=1 Tax=Ursus americanus TaxID=9643 RepID=A0A452RBG2_URSAM